jgi:cyclohexanone monooxygenase
MSTGEVHEFNTITLATGFHSVTGALKVLDIQGTQGMLRDEWEHALLTHLGIGVSWFPNSFTIHGP